MDSVTSIVRFWLPPTVGTGIPISSVTLFPRLDFWEFILYAYRQRGSDHELSLLKQADLVPEWEHVFASGCHIDSVFFGMTAPWISTIRPVANTATAGVFLNFFFIDWSVLLFSAICLSPSFGNDLFVYAVFLRTLWPWGTDSISFHVTFPNPRVNLINLYRNSDYICWLQSVSSSCLCLFKR